jgi:DNA-directed RNA polymerase specialized sigma24 family protein
MLDIDKEVLNRKYNDGDMDYFFDKAQKITDFVLTKTYKIYDSEKRADMVQECLENLWKKVQQGKIDPTKNLMSFIWTNSNFRIKEILRKEQNRNRIAPMISYDNEELEFLKGIDSAKYGEAEIEKIFA